jgi:hypothetical protein
MRALGDAGRSVDGRTGAECLLGSDHVEYDDGDGCGE